MKKFRIPMLTSIVMLALVACSADQNYERVGSYDANQEESRAAASPENDGLVSEGDAGNQAAFMPDSMMSSTAAQISPLFDSSHQFIRRAEARFRVENVRKATFQIEKITAKYGGYVASTVLDAEKERESQIKISDDSSLVTTYFTVRNDLVLRIPAENLDSTLRSLVPLVAFLDFRRIHVEDVTLKLLRERLAARRIGSASKRLESALDKSNSKLRDRAAVEESLYNKQTMADEAYLKRMEINDQVQLSTIQIHIYQRETWTQEMIANEKPVNAYKQGFFSRFGKSLKNGWDGLLEFLIFLGNAWPILLLMTIVAIVLRWLIRKQKK